MGDPRRSDDIDRLSTLVSCFLAEGSGAGIGLLGALRATGLLAEVLRPSPDEVPGQQAPTPSRPGS